MKVIILAALFAIIGSMGHALSAMIAGPSGAERMARALTVRIAVSVALFVFLMVSWYIGVLVPHGAG